ncbi:hypothetical protein [Candidatus Nitrosotenuis cloacae]|jgi:hypothetical protein|uniref:hypothetical protein n=1 Tax=Candidatus Nitrosotenuis cloacae TaxID=1603555 RepID=UPI002280BC82|nr:hypothetical protein [Candidatus Nitrosotenuis cloacae]
MESRTSKLEDMYDKIEAEEGRKMSQADGYQWGLEYLKDIQKQIERLQHRALEKNDPVFYNNVKMSMQRARDAEEELRAKLDGAKGQH